MVLEHQSNRPCLGTVRLAESKSGSSITRPCSVERFSSLLALVFYAILRLRARDDRRHQSFRDEDVILDFASSRPDGGPATGPVARRRPGALA